MVVAMGEAFGKIHKLCPKTWKEPTTEETQSTQEKMNTWLAVGEHGTSSKTIYSVLSGQSIIARTNYCHPLDPDDFKRCHKLLEMIPEWRGEMHEMRAVSPVWAKLVDDWPMLTDMLLEQLKTHKPNGMYERMRTLGC